MQSIEVIAHAKINLVLSVLNRRPDGYHNIWSLMQTLELHDSLAISCDTTSDWSDTVASHPTRFPITLECSDARLPCNEENLVFRAAGAVMQKAGMYPRLHVRIIKRIPIAAGLGGGSSDAAATIQALNHLLRLGWGNTECARLGADIGSDVPFFFHGLTSIVRGQGEDVNSVDVKIAQWVVLVKPPVDISTAQAYDQLDAWRASRGNRRRFAEDEEAHAFLQLPRSSEAVYPYYWNAFEEMMEERFPTLRTIRQQLCHLGADVAMLSGSGSTVFGVYSSEDLAINAGENISNQNCYQVWTTKMKVS